MKEEVTTQTKELSILFTGDELHPSKLGELLGVPVHVMAERDAISEKGRYKGQASPFGMGVVNIEEEIPLFDLIEKWTEILHAKNQEIKELGVEDIEIMWDVEGIDGDDVFIPWETLKKIVELGAEIRILNLKQHVD